MYKDAIDTAADSGDQKIAEELLEFFVNVGDKPCFAATLFTCSKLIRPEVVMEYAWKNGLMDFAMPFLQLLLSLLLYYQWVEAQFSPTVYSAVTLHLKLSFLPASSAIRQSLSPVSFSNPSVTLTCSSS